MTERTLVVVLCETRGHARTYSGFERNLLDVFGADLALCVADNAREDKDNPFYRRARHIWTCPEYDDWGQGLEEQMSGLHPRWRECAAIGTQWMGGIKSEPDHPGSGGIILFFRIFLRQMLLQHGLLEHYDRFIITRSDYMWDVSHPPAALMANRFIWIPDGEHYGGLTDRHIVCSSDSIIEALSAADLFTENPDDVVARMRGRDWNVEQVLKDHFQRTGLSGRLRKMPYIMYTIREAGGHTSWSEGEFDEAMGVYVKYPEEYRKSKFAAKILGTRPWSRAVFRYLIGRETARCHLFKQTRSIRRVARKAYRLLAGRPH